MDSVRIDFHSHLVPAVDDGSRGAVETLAMARGLVELGVRRIHVTPHVYRYGNMFGVLELERHAEDVRRLCRDAELAVEIVAGAEYCLGEHFLNALENGRPFLTFSHDGEECILAEIHPRRFLVGLPAIGAALRSRGVRPVLAHPERHPSTLTMQRLGELRDAGWRFQLNLPSLVGCYGDEIRARGWALLERGWTDLAGSDLHRPNGLPALLDAHAALRRWAAPEVRS